MLLNYYEKKFSLAKRCEERISITIKFYNSIKYSSAFHLNHYLSDAVWWINTLTLKTLILLAIKGEQ